MEILQYKARTMGALLVAYLVNNEQIMTKPSDDKTKIELQEV